MKSLLNLGQRFLADEKAAELTEVGIVLALVVVASVTAVTLLGTSISNTLTTTAADI